MATDTSTGTEPRKRQNLDYRYRDHEGALQESFTEDSRSVHVTVLASGESVELSINDVITDAAVVQRLADDFPMAIMGFLFGAKTTVGNAVTSVKNGDAGDMLRALETRRNTIVEDKEWRGDAGGGPRTGHIIEAVSNIIRAQTGKELNQTGKDALKAEIKTKGSKPFTDDPTIAAELAAMEHRRAQEKLEAKRRQAAEAGTSGLMGSILQGLQ